MNNDDIADRLEAMGRRAAPPVDADFADRLESHLRVTGAGLADGPARRPIWQPLTGVALAALVVIAGTVAVLRSQSGGDDVLVLSASTETEIVLPGGSVVEATEGLELPDGARIEVGDRGSATVNEVVLQEGSVAIVADGQLEILRDAPPTDRTTTTPPTTSEPSPTTTPPTTAETTTTSTTPETSTTLRDGSQTTPTTPATVPSTRPPTTDAPPTTTTTTTITDQIAPVIVLTAGPPVAGEVVLEWSWNADHPIAGWEVRGARGDSVRTVALLRDPTARRLVIAQPERGDARYWVLARGSGVEIVAESNQVIVSAP